MRSSEDISALIPALCKAQASIQNAKKDKENPFHHNKYADINSIQEACKVPLMEQGLVIMQDVGGTTGAVSICTRIIHTSGQWIEVGPLMVPDKKNDAQGVGSAITYGRRYSMAAMLCIITEEDDDGNQAANLTPVKKTAETKKTSFPISPVNSKGKKISAEQLHNLEISLRKCTADFCKRVDETILEKFGATTRAEIPEENLNGMFDWINIHLKAQEKKIHEESNV